MRVVREDVELQGRFFLPKISKSIFIHPTDTVYGIGCDATNKLLVMKLRLIKKWHTQPFTVIAPSKEWVLENLEVPESALKHFPGAVTIIAKLKNPRCVCEDVHLGKNVLGVRIPNHWISNVVSKMGKPVVSSCANKHSEDLMTSLENADPELIKASEVILHEGPKEGKPSVFIDFTEGIQIITQ